MKRKHLDPVKGKDLDPKVKGDRDQEKERVQDTVIKRKPVKEKILVRTEEKDHVLVTGNDLRNENGHVKETDRSRVIENVHAIIPVEGDHIPVIESVLTPGSVVEDQQGTHDLVEEDLAPTLVQETDEIEETAHDTAEVAPDHEDQRIGKILGRTGKATIVTGKNHPKERSIRTAAPMGKQELQ